MIDPSTVGERLKALRMKRNMTQKQIAAVLGITPQAVSSWECGNTYPDPAYFDDLVKVLDCSLDEIFLGSNGTAG